MEALIAKLGDVAAVHAAETQRTMHAEPPALLENVELHDYQVIGMRWLLAKRAQGLSPILGDEMGLGKTLQVIAFIASLMSEAAPSDKEKEKKKKKRYLIVAPLSVLPNWMEQFERFAPRAATAMYIGAQADRAAMQTAVESSTAEHLVVVTSYEMVMFDIGFFGRVDWEVAIFDEGHRLKNPKGKLYEVIATQLRAPHKVVLSGTPIQNDLRELFALLSLLNPSIFDNYSLFESAFRDYFSAKAQRLVASTDGEKATDPKLERARGWMKRILSPLLLLRTIRDVNDSFTLPPISEIVVHTPLSAMQRVYYKKIVARNVDEIQNVAKNHASRISLINVLPHLRKACNHPYLFPGAEPEPFEEGSHLYENSGKLYVLHQILPRLRADGHVVLLFSQSTAFLDIIQDFLTLESFSYERIDGSVRGKERWQSIERFRSDPDVFVFLISARSGGVGLNLQRADTVIFVDSDYNPQVDLQAVARAYRLGQTKPIHVIKFVCANTVEESIYRRALKKMQMADMIRNIARKVKGDGDDGSSTSSESEETLLEMIQFGLHKLLEEDGVGEDALMKPLGEEYIQYILARNGTTGDAGDSVKTAPTESSVKNEQLLESGGDFSEENIYYFEGEDYSKAKENKTRDEASLLKLCAEFKTGSKARRATGTTNRARYEHDKGEDDDEDDDEVDGVSAKELAQQREERRQKALARKLAAWRASGYESMAINIDADIESTDASADALRLSGDNTRLLHFRSGDASQPPLTYLPSDAVIIVHCVDNSGIWSSRGFFRCLSALSPLVQQQYEAAGRNSDLKLGSAHLIQLPPQNAADDSDGGRTIERYVCLLVVQGFQLTKGATKKQRVANGVVVRQGKSTMFRLNALNQALEALAQRARMLDASVHMPRIGYGTPRFNWYAVERLIKRNLRDKGVDTSIYYFSRASTPAT